MAPGLLLSRAGRRFAPTRGFVLLVATAALFSSLTPAEAADPLAEARLRIQGNRLTIYADSQTTDAEQVINVGERARVRTCYGGEQVACGSVLPGDPRVAGFEVRAELSGPELPEPLPMSTVPGGSFLLPAFQQHGDYRLDNIRLVEVATGRTVGMGEPPTAVLHVVEIVLTSASVRALTLAELQARGIALTQENFQAFNFAVGFAFGDETVVINFPVLYTQGGEVEPLDKPEVSLDGLPKETARRVQRWQPPRIVPFVLEVKETNYLEEREEENQKLTFPLFGAIVMPGTVTFLNQFFEAKLIVANGAPQGSTVALKDVQGAIRLPGSGALRLARTDPPVSPGQQVPVVQGNGSRVLSPGEQGFASWTVEGLVAGTHSLAIDIAGELLRPGRDPLPVASRAQAAVEVVDARFNLTFSHPDVVREGEEYSLFVTVTNLSRVPQNQITVQLRREHITGAHPSDGADTFSRTIETLAPGAAETLEFRLIADLTGKVVAATFQADSSAGQGAILLRTGVGELGIPLSPATLVLPRFTERLAPPYTASDELLRANVRLLGLAYSLAVAPAGMVPPGLPHVTKADVQRRAVDLAEAGQRTFLQERLLESLEVLALDQLGNRHPLAEFDELRRRLEKGRKAAQALASLIRAEQSRCGLDAVELFDHFAATTSYAPPYLAAMVAPVGSSPIPVLEIRRPTEVGMAYLAYTGEEAERPTPLRTLPFAEVLAVAERAGGSTTVPFAIVGHIEQDQVFSVFLHNQTDGEQRGRLVLLLPQGSSGDFRRVDFGPVKVPPHTVVGVEVGARIPGPDQGGLRLFYPATGFPVSEQGPPTVSLVARPLFRLIGAVQDFGMPDRYGNGVSYLFNRPPARDGAEDASNYEIVSTFDGLDVNGQQVHRVATWVGKAAFQQSNGRVVNVRFAAPISPLLAPDGSPLVRPEHRINTPAIRDAWGEALAADVPPVVVETTPRHYGGLVDGRVLRGSGEPVAGAKVQLLRTRWQDGFSEGRYVLDLVAETTTDADGLFYFDFVEEPHPDASVQRQFTLRATVPPGDDPLTEPGAVEEVSSVIRQQGRLAHVNIALLGRGTVQGKLVYLDTGEPVNGGEVTVVSMLFSEMRTARVAADGSFTFAGVPVGPLTLTGRDPEGRRAYATVGLEKPGAVVEVRLEIQRSPPPGSGTVIGKVLRQRAGTPAPPPEPAVGARVAIYSEGHFIAERTADNSGAFRFSEVPAGKVSVQAADWGVSRTPVLLDLILAADETVSVTLTLPESTPRVVTGRVLFLDPITNTAMPVQGAVAFIKGPGVFAYTEADGTYRIEGVPTQGIGERPYLVTAIDMARTLQGEVLLPPITDASPEVVVAQDIVLRETRGAVEGVVLDPLGRPLGGVSVVLWRAGAPMKEVVSDGNASFFFDDVPIGQVKLIAHVGDGLQPGRVGYFGEAEATVVYGGHKAFATVRLRGSGVVLVKTRTATSTGILTPIYYKPTCYSEAEKRIRIKGAYIESSTDQNGELELVLPVGEFELVAYNPFHGSKKINSAIDFAGQVRTLEVVFEDASTVTGRVVDVDGMTPLPNVEVTLKTEKLLPQKQRTDGQGQFRFELVPKGNVEVSVDGTVGSLRRVGVAYGAVTQGGQTLDLTVVMKAQGTIAGRVVERLGNELVPLPYAQYYVRENSFPFRRLPAGDQWYTAGADGTYTVSHVYAGRVTVVARDSRQLERQGWAAVTITADWETVQAPDIVVSAAGSLGVVVRDPQTGGVVPDCQVKLQEGGWNENDVAVTVADAEGHAFFDALEVGRTYFVYVFHAPSGRSGRSGELRLTSGGQRLETTIYLQSRGEIRGTLYEDESLLVPVAGATVQLVGDTPGGPLRALATTSGAPESRGRFVLAGIPEGSYTLEAAAPTSPRRASAAVRLTATAPIADVNLVLEPVQDLYFRLFEKLRAGDREVDPSSGLFSVGLSQSGYDFSQLQPAIAYPGHAFRFPDVLVTRRTQVSAQELSGERRTARVAVRDTSYLRSLGGSGTATDPYHLTLSPKGVVTITVKDSTGAPVPGAQVTLASGGEVFSSVTAEDGTVGFWAVSAGEVAASATWPLHKFGGIARGTLTYDDDVIELNVTLGPAVSAHGIVYQPVPDDRYHGDPGTLVPAEGAIVEITDSRGERQAIVTGADGGYRFNVLPTGPFTVTAWSASGQAWRSITGTLHGPDGFDNEIPPLILDAAPPRVVSLTPPPGMEEVSRTAVVEIVFSEPLFPGIAPDGQPSSPYFQTRSASGATPVGSWSTATDSLGRPVVRFTPSVAYENSTVYTVTIVGGPNGVRDRAGRPLTERGNVASNFKTSDTVGPAVIATDPDLSRPVDPTKPIRFDFNEAVFASDENLDGDGFEDAAELYWERDSAGVRSWQPLPASLSLTRSGYSASVTPSQGLDLSGDTLRRKVIVGRLKDAHGNVMEPREWVFRIYDANPPVIAVPAAPGTPPGQLTVGGAYAIVPTIVAADEMSPANPAGDLERVDYFLKDPLDPSNPTKPAYSARSFPFAYSFVAVYTGDGTAPSPFRVWARAVDTSTNQSAPVLVEMEVLPNVPPTIGNVSAAALSPVAGTFYAGSTVRATVAGLADQDGAQLMLVVELWQEGGSSPLSVSPGRALQRPSSGDWTSLAPQTFDFKLPITLAEGTVLFFRARATDQYGATATLESERFAVADDALPPMVDSIVVRSVTGGAGTLFHIGDAITVEFRARDAETAVQQVEVAFDAVFAAPQTATLVPGSANLYRTGTLTVPSTVTADTPIVVTVTARDHGGNSGTASAEFHVAPTSDPTAPTVEWISPWQGAPWPAAYDSVVDAAGTALLLRVHVRDTSLDDNGQTVPGAIAEVQFRGPVRSPQGIIDLAQEWSAASLLPGSSVTGGGTYQLLWRVPNRIPAGTRIPFEVRVADTGAKVTLRLVELVAQPARKVYEGVQTAVQPNDPMQAADGAAEGVLFLLDGATVSLYPPNDGVRRFASVVLHPGGTIDAAGGLSVRASVLTVPEITSYASSTLYYPLELEAADLLAVGAGCSVSVSSRGLLGAGSGVSVALPGETAAAPLAGGSHGGAGWFGSPEGGWNRAVLNEPGSVYDSVRQPSLPGGGGGAAAGWQGGTGGGVLRLNASGAVVHLAGAIVADGAAPPGCGGASQALAGGGAGGSIFLQVGRLEGTGRISANGGHSCSPSRSGGGGGGRIATYYRELGDDFDFSSQVTAHGGDNGFNDPGRRTAWGGPGTVYIEQLQEPGGEPSGIGLLSVRHASDLRAAVTPLPALGSGEVVDIDAFAGKVTLTAAEALGTVVGERLVLESSRGEKVGSFAVIAQRRIAEAGSRRVELTVAGNVSELEAARALLLAGERVLFHGLNRYAAVTVHGRARLVCADDIEIGGADVGTPALNDRASFALDAAARVLLRGEQPNIAVNSSVGAGSDVRGGATIDLAWSADDPLGIAKAVESLPFAVNPTVRVFTEEPLAITSGASPTQVVVPWTAEPGPVSYAVEVVDVAGRRSKKELRWNVLPNGAPSAALRLSPEVVLPLKAGYPAKVLVHAEDPEGLASATLAASGPVRETTQAKALAGTSADVEFVVNTIPDADGTTPVVVQVVVSDRSGATFTSETLQIPIVPNEQPQSSLSLATGQPSAILPGRSTQVVVHAEDPDGVANIQLRAEGPATEPVQAFAPPGAPAQADATFTVTAQASAPAGPITLVATVADKTGRMGDSLPLVVSVVEDQPPSGSLEVTPGAGVYPNHNISVSLSLADDNGLAKVTVLASGAFVWQEEMALSGTTATPTVTTRVPVAAAGGTNATVAATVVDSFGHVVTLAPVSVPILADSTPPQVTRLSPADGTEVTSGATVDFRFDLRDEVVANQVTLTVDGNPVDVSLRNVRLPGDIWQAEAVALGWRAPEVSSSRALRFVFTATDAAGNQTRHEGSITVNPLVDPTAPKVAISCPVNGNAVVGGVPITITFTLEAMTTVNPSNLIQLYNVLVDGTTIFTQTGVDKQKLQTTYVWTPPADAPRGQKYLVRIEARDYAGNVGFDEVSLVVPDVPSENVLRSGGTLSSSFNGKALVLAQGTFTATEALDFAELTLLQGVTLQGTSGQPLRITTGGTLRLGCGANLDVSGLGYSGGYQGHADGFAPVGVSGSKPDAGGSHGGVGIGGGGSGPAGEVFDSVYEPGLGGGGGALDCSSCSGNGGNGGGVVVLEVGALVLDGEIRARGQGQDNTYKAAGAGGAVVVRAGEVRGVGRVDVLGGDYTNRGSGSRGVGGGGRVAWYVDRFVDFDPWERSVAWGGAYISGGTARRFAGAGTVYVRGPDAVYGDLLVDGRGGGAIPVLGETWLPGIGTGIVGSVTADGQNPADAWIEPQDPAAQFSLGVVGMWVRVGGADYRVGAQADRRRLLLEGAAGQVNVGDAYQGVYKFDRITVKGGAKLVVPDPAEVGNVVVESGSTLTWYNDEAPTIDPSKVTISAHDGFFWVAGQAGAASDADGLKPAATLRNLTTQATTAVTLAANGSFAATKLTGSAGDAIELEVSDAHPSPRTTKLTVGALPANAAPPQWAADLQARITLSPVDATAWRVRGSAGSVADPEPPIRVTARNTRTGAQAETSAAADGSFELLLAAAEGEGIELVASDGHPQPLAAVVGGIIIPANAPPVVDPSRIELSAHDGAFWIAGQAGAVSDLDGIATASVMNARTGSSWPLALPADGSFAPVQLAGSAGDIIQLVATDKGTPAKTTVAEIGPLPANASGPKVNRSLLNLARDGDEGCGQLRLVGAAGVFEDPNPPFKVTVTNQRTGRQWNVAPAPNGSFAVALEGSGGDGFTLAVTDGHPNPLTASETLALPANRPPVVDVAQASIEYWESGEGGSAFVIKIPAGAVTDPDNNRVAITAINQRTGVESVGRFDCSGAEVWLFLEAGNAELASRSGDIVELRLVDDDTLNPLTTTVVLGPLPNTPPTVKGHLISLLPLGFGFQVAARPGAVEDPNPPLSVVLQNEATGWTSTPIAVEPDGSFYARIEGSSGDEITMVATDGWLQDPASTEAISLGLLPGEGVQTTLYSLAGHTVSAIKDDFFILDGGSALGELDWNSSPPILRATYPGLVHARDVVFNLKAQRPMALDGGSLVGWQQDAGGPWQPVAWPLSQGTLTHGEALGDALVVVAEEAEGIALLRVTEPLFDQAGWLPDCGDAVQSVTLPGTVGLRSLALLPAPNASVAVLVDDPLGELRMASVADPGALVAGAALDLPGGGVPTWGSWQNGELLVGRADGSVDAYRWREGGMDLLASWRPASGSVKGAALMGRQLWALLDGGVLQQVDFSDPAQPRMLGELQLDGPPLAFQGEWGLLLVSTATSLVEVDVQVMPPAFAPHLTAWGHGTGGSFVYAPSISGGGEWRVVRWGYTPPGDYCWATTVQVAEEITQAPTLQARADGVIGPPFTPSSLLLRDFDQSSGPWFAIWGARPERACSVNRGAEGSVYAGDWTWWRDWQATAVSGQPGVDCVFEDGQPRHVHLATAGPVAGLFSGEGGGSLLVVGAGVEEWDLNPQSGGEVANPHLVRQIELFGADDVAAAARAALSGIPSLVLAANSPGRIAVLHLDAARTVVADGVALPALDGTIVAIAADENARLWVLTDSPSGARLYRYDITEPTSPALLGQMALPTGAPASALSAAAPADSPSWAIVLRRGWGVEVYDENLIQRAALPLPGDPQGVFENRVALGDLGVAVLTGLPSSPTAMVVDSNGSSPGRAVGFTDGGEVLTPDGVVMFGSTFGQTCASANPIGFSPAAPDHRAGRPYRARVGSPMRVRKTFPWLRGSVRK